MKPSYKVRDFGVTKYGEKARAWELQGAGGMILDVTDFGGKVIRLLTPDRHGEMKDITIGFDSPAGWDATDPYWGSIIGRYGNRIAKGKFTLNNVEYTIPLNNEPGNIPCGLHGGTRGWDAFVWGAEPFVKDDDVGIIFSRTSPDGENGFPGKVDVSVIYTVTKDNTWRIEYKATPDKDTPINMTQHVYFNFKGEAGGSIEDHTLWIDGDATTPTDIGLIPMGEVAPVEGTPFDFRKPTLIGARINAKNQQLEFGRGYDHNWVLNKKVGEMKKVAELTYSGNGRGLEVWTTEPCIQIYTGNWAEYEWTAKGGEHLSFRCGIAMETQHAPDSPNRPEWPTTIVKAGQLYHTVTEYRFFAK